MRHLSRVKKVKLYQQGHTANVSLFSPPQSTANHLPKVSQQATMSTSQVPIPTMAAIFTQCPPLPPISDSALLERVYTHRSYAARPSNVFEDQPSNPTVDNESLEHLGDSVVNLCTTVLIQTLFPHLHVGPASRIRALVVANTHLARFTQFYQLHFQLRGNSSQQLTIQASLPIHADLFEAYVGALYKEQGLEPVQTWLSAVFTPSVYYAYEVIRHTYQQIPASAQAALVFPSDAPAQDMPPVLLSPPLPAPESAGFTSLLNQHYSQQKKYLDWEFDAPTGPATGPTWTAKAVVRGEVELAQASANTKKAAKNAAARIALISLGLLQEDTGASVPHVGAENA